MSTVETACVSQQYPKQYPLPVATWQATRQDPVFFPPAT